MVLTALCLAVVSNLAVVRTATAGTTTPTATATYRIWQWNVSGNDINRGSTSDGMIEVAVHSIVSRDMDFASFNELCYNQYKQLQSELVAAGWPADTGNFSRFGQNVPSGTKTYCGGQAFGEAIFSKEPLGGSTLFTLPSDGDFSQRTLLCAPLEAEPHVRYCTTHISTISTPVANPAGGYYADDADQINAVLDHLEAYHAQGDTVLISGDFNAQPNYARMNGFYSSTLDTPNNSDNTGHYRELDDNDPGNCLGYGEWTVVDNVTTDPPPCGGQRKIDMIFVRDDKIAGPYSADALSISTDCTNADGSTGMACSDHRILTGTVEVSYDRAPVSPSGPLSSKVAGVCADDPSGTTTTGTKVEVYACNGSPAQDWTLASDSTVRADGDPDVCVGAAGGATAVGTPVQLEACSGAAGQQWAQQSGGALENTGSGLCLADPGGSTANGTQLQLAACDGSDQVGWTLPGTGPVDRWLLNESSGTVAHDGVAAADATVVGGVTWGTSKDAAGTSKPAATFNGTTGALATSFWGVNTTHGFTLSAWVRLGDVNRNQDLLSQGGSTSYAFDLYYSSAYDAWVFGRSAGDTTSPALTRAMSTQTGVTPAVNTWTHLVAVYDDGTGPTDPAVRLYVDGAMVSSVQDTDPAWSATGHLQIGRALWNGSYSYADASIADVQHYDRPLTDAEVQSLYTTGSPS